MVERLRGNYKENNEEAGNEFSTENRDAFLVYTGLRYTGTWRSVAHSTFVVTIMMLAEAHFVMKVIFLSVEEGFQVGVEAVHYIVMMSAVIFTALQILLNYRLYRYLTVGMRRDDGNTRARAGPGGQIVIAATREEVTSRHWAVVSSVMFAHVICATKEPLLARDRTWVLPYKGWFPFAVNSWPAYLAAFTFQIVAMTHLAMSVIAIVSVYISLAGHICGQLKILQISVPLCFERAAMAAKSVRDPAGCGDRIFENTLYRNIKKCVGHHILISQFFRTFQSLYSSILLAWSLAFIFMICTVGFLITDPYTELTEALTLSSLLLPEVSILMIVCLYGQKISDQVDILREVVYNTDWYDQSLRVKQALRMIMKRCLKPMLITGGGLQSYSLMGLREMLFSSYTYFNMLIALRNKQERP